MLSDTELKQLDAKLETYSQSAHELETALQDPLLLKSPANYKKVGVDYNKLQDKLKAVKRIRELATQLTDNQTLKHDADQGLSELINLEEHTLKAELEKLQAELIKLEELADPLDSANCIIEIRAGAGGDEASLFAQELMRGYLRYAELLRLDTDIANISYSSTSGFKEAIFFVTGLEAYKQFKYENGVHRVQRVPVTEASGRIHTSTVSVVVLPEVPDVEVNIKAEEIRIDVYRSSGPGGQSVNTTDSAVRIVHLPTGITVTCQDQKSQLKNKAQALKILQAKLYDLAQSSQNEKLGELRQSAIKSGDRSAKIRTYNFPQSRVTDHRIKQSWHNINEVMEGNFSSIAAAVSQQLKPGEPLVLETGNEDDDEDQD